MFRIVLQRDFSKEYKKFLLSSDRCKTILTLAKVQPFCMKQGLDIGVYNLNNKRILPQTVKQENVCLYLYKNHLCVLWKLKRRTSLLDAVVEMGNSFRYKETQINVYLLKQVIE